MGSYKLNLILKIERLIVELEVGEFKSQAMMSLHICYKNDGMQPKLKNRCDIF